MFGDGRYDDSSDRRPPPVRERLNDPHQPVQGSGRQDHGPPLSSSDYYHGASGLSSSYTMQGGGHAVPHPQQHYSYPVQRQSDRYQQQPQQQKLREPRDERRTNTREPHSYHVHSLTQIGLVHQSTSNEDSFRLRPRKAEPGNPARKYICEECDASFERPSALNTHRLSHRGEKPFHCSHPGCGKAFTSMSNKTRHEKTHYATSAFEDRDASSSSRQQKGSSASSYYYYSSRGR